MFTQFFIIEYGACLQFCGINSTVLLVKSVDTLSDFLSLSS